MRSLFKLLLHRKSEEEGSPPAAGLLVFSEKSSVEIQSPTSFDGSLLVDYDDVCSFHIQKLPLRARVRSGGLKNAQTFDATKPASIKRAFTESVAVATEDGYCEGYVANDDGVETIVILDHVPACQENLQPAQILTVQTSNAKPRSVLVPVVERVGAPSIPEGQRRLLHVASALTASFSLDDTFRSVDESSLSESVTCSTEETEDSNWSSSYGADSTAVSTRELSSNMQRELQEMLEEDDETDDESTVDPRLLGLLICVPQPKPPFAPQQEKAALAAYRIVDVKPQPAAVVDTAVAAQTPIVPDKPTNTRQRRRWRMIR